MAAQQSTRPLRRSKTKRQPRSQAQIAKGRDHVSNPGLRCRNGLLNTAIPARCERMEIARRNSVQSPLLRFPGELRDRIWRFALGDHQIHIQDLNHEEPVDSADSAFNIRTLYPDTLVPPGFVRPTFQLPRVCRQIYVEASPYVYTLNTFTFHSMATLDRWIKDRCLGQRRFIASLDVPRTYMRLYRTGFRKSFRTKFPNIARVGVDNWSLFCAYDQIRRLPENRGRSAIAMWNEAKTNIIMEIKDKEGQDILVSWHGHSS